ncbi:MAG: leucine-rich repeat protein, partial [Clostridia bacterium]|nr:leucine-rich repeat protein [Clostridia bacterium]
YELPGVTSIGVSAFSGCTGLTTVTIPSTVTSIGSYAFRNCTGLTTINFQGTMAQWNAISKGSDWNYTTGSYTIYMHG